MKTSPRVLSAFSAAVLSLCLLAPVARADSSAQDQAVAQSLYDDARKLTAGGKYADACPKFEESQRLDPTPVTSFWLADCYEHVGRTASAWAAFLDVAAAAKRSGGPKAEERERVARDRAKALEPKLSQLVIDVPAGVRVPGLLVKRDGEVVREGQWGARIAVDPGNHSIEASAPGKQAWTKTQDVEGAGQTTTVHIEALADAAAASAAAAAPATTSTSTSPPTTMPPPGDQNTPPDSTTQASPLKVVGLATAGLGVVGIAIGSVFGLQAISKNSDANKGHCGAAFGGTNQCDATGVSLRKDAVSAGNISTVAFIAGGVLAAGGAALFFLAPSHSVQVAPAVGAAGGGVLVQGTF
jgi:hypothetical protein